MVGKFLAHVDSDIAVVQSCGRDRFAQKIGRFAPFPNRLEQTGFEAGRIEQMINRASEAPDSLLQLRAIGLLLLQRARHRGQRGLQFVRDGIEECFL